MLKKLNYYTLSIISISILSALFAFSVSIIPSKTVTEKTAVNTLQNDSCSGVIEIPALEFIATQSTCGSSSMTLNQPCLNEEHFGGGAYVYAYTPIKDMNISIEVLFKERPARAGLAVLDTCPHVAAKCLFKNTYNEPIPTGPNPYTTINNIDLKADKTYYIVVAGGKCVNQGQGIYSIGCEDETDDAERRCSCGKVEYNPNSTCPDDDEVEYYCICPPSCTSGEAFCSDFQLNMKRNPVGKIPNSTDCGNENLGFENGTMANWKAARYNGDIDRCNVISTPIPDEISCTQAPCKDPNNYDMCPITPVDGFDFPDTAPIDAPMTECSNMTDPFKNDARFTLTSGGFDPNTDNKLSAVAPNGSTYSVRIGNQGAGYQAECMWNEFNVTEQNKIFVYQYAMVLQDPMHPLNQHKTYDSPRFYATLTDLNGTPVGCGNKFNIISQQARDLKDGFEIAQNPACNRTAANEANEKNWSNVYYKPWTTIGVDLSDYIGQTLRIKFCTADCGKGGHYAYAYVDVYCLGPEIGYTTCSFAGEPVTLTAPPGFSNYTWYEGPDTNGNTIGRGLEIDIPNPVDSGVYTVSFNPLAGTEGCSRSVVHDTIIVYDQIRVEKDTIICPKRLQSGDSIPLFARTSKTEGLSFNWYAIPDNGFTSTEQNPVLKEQYIPRENTQIVLEVTTDFERCYFTDTIAITIVDCGPKIKVNSDSVCIGTCPDEIMATIDVDSAKPPYIITWSDSFFNNGDPVAVPSVLGPYSTCNIDSAFTYSVIISDSEGLSDTADGIIYIYYPPELKIAGTNTTCGDCNGTTQVWDTSATSDPGTTYLWSTGATVQQLNSLCPGTYSVTATTPFGCQDTASVTIINLEEHSITTTNDSVPCPGDTTGVVATIITNDQHGPYTYQWDAAARNQTDSLATGLGAGTYIVTVTSSIGCVKVDTAYVYEPSPVGLATTPVNVPCYGDSTGSIDLSATGGTPPLYFNWVTDNGFIPSGQDTLEDLSGLIPGTYEVMVTDANGCTYYTGNSITQPPLLTVSVDSGVTCRGYCKGALTAVPEGGTPPYSYLWSDSTAQSSQVAQELCAGGPYVVTVTDANGCTAIDSSFIRMIPAPDAQSWEFLECPGAIIKLPSTENGVSYEWRPGTGLSFTNVAHPHARIKDEITYYVTITNKWGCSWVDTVYIDVRFNPSYKLHVPNAFTPNGDGFDDYFQFVGDFSGIVEFECQIWNRWGEKVYHTYDINKPWNGRYNGTGELVKDGAYVFVVKAKDDCAMIAKKWDKRIGWVIVLKGDSQ